MSEDKKIEVHQDFEKWYEEIGEKWTRKEAQEAFAITLINQMGFGYGLKNSNKKNVSGDYPELAGEMQAFKRKYTLAVLNGYKLRTEQKYHVEFPALTSNGCFLNKKINTGEFFAGSLKVISGYQNSFTEKEIKEIDVRYMAFAVPVDEIELAPIRGESE